MRVRIGYGLGVGALPDGAAFAELVDGLERCGFDSLWLSERATGDAPDPLVGLAFAVAASANLPAILLSLYWRRFSTAGAVAGILAGLGACLLLVAVGPAVLGPKGIWLHGMQPLFPLENPGIVSIPLGFAAAVVASLRYPDPEPAAARRYRDLRARALTGTGEP